MPKYGIAPLLFWIGMRSLKSLQKAKKFLAKDLFSCVFVV